MTVPANVRDVWVGGLGPFLGVPVPARGVVSTKWQEAWLLGALRGAGRGSPGRRDAQHPFMDAWMTFVVYVEAWVT